MKVFSATATALAFLAAPVFAAPEAYELDPSHSQVVFTYEHFGFSTTTNMFAGINGNISFDQENPANSSVSVSFPVKSLYTGWEARYEDFMGERFFNAQDDEVVTFKSTGIEVTGEKTAKITGDLTLNGVTKSVVLDAEMNSAREHPMAKKAWAGFDATTTLLRSDYNLGFAAPAVSDAVEVYISIEAAAAE